MTGLLLLLGACVQDLPDAPDAFADVVVAFEPGPGAGFGLPADVLGPPVGGGERAGSLDVLSLGDGGEIVLGFDAAIIDGPGPDLLVFENPFPGWIETGEVAVSLDGESWVAWDCDVQTLQGCAGVNPVLAHPDNELDPTDPAQAGGDAFDLADLSLDAVWFLRIRDTGTNPDEAPTAGFDLDAVAAIHGD